LSIVLSVLQFNASDTLLASIKLLLRSVIQRVEYWIRPEQSADNSCGGGYTPQREDDRSNF